MENIIENALKKMEPAVLAATLGTCANKSNKKRQLDDDDGDGDGSGNSPSANKIRKPNEDVNLYSGWKVPSNKYEIPTISTSITPELFYKEYVSKRRPVVLRGSLEDLAHLQKWTNQYLKESIKGKVMVEKRAESKASFGRGNEIPMSFTKFIDLIESGDDMHYLTTQDVQADEDGRPDLMASFMKCLKNDFPLRPKIVGNLVPQNINIWMGNNKEGASSGLHHDYHDNLYCVLRGKKRFRLFSPGDAEKMSTRGKLVKVHANGRINYEGEVTTAYGADLQSDAAADASRAKDEAENRLLAAELAVKEGRDGAEEELEEAERMLEEAMDALIDIEMENDDRDESDGDDEDDDDDEEKDVALFGGQNEGINIRTDSDDDDDHVNGDISPAENDNDDTENLCGRILVDKTVKNPDNFSLVPHHILDNEEEIRSKYPKLMEAKVSFCEIEAGEILYLPASWFHEVTSFGGHLAFNYWFHPPDAHDDFDNPYTTNFWSNDFKQRLVTLA